MAGGVNTESTHTVNVSESKKYGCFWWGLVASIILIIVIVIIGIIVFIFTGNAAIEIGVILGTLILMGLLALIFIEAQRKKAKARRLQSYRETPRSLIKKDIQPVNVPMPSAPPRSTASSWAPWRKSTSSSSTTSPIYHEVAREDRP